MKRLILVNILFAVWFSLGGCSGGGTDLAAGGIGGTGFTEGPISGFGSIFVNGIQYDTSQAEVVINGESVSADALRLGMIVSVSGNHDSVSGIAERIEFQEDLRGSVTMLDNSRGLMWILGQSVSVDNLTVFEGVDALAQINIGDTIQVSGLSDSNGSFHATRVVLLSSQQTDISDTGNTTISPRPPLIPPNTVRGQITQLDSNLQHFRIGELSVDYSQARERPATLRDGNSVLISGTLNGAVLQAEVVRAWQPVLPGDPTVPVKLVGVITRFANLADFDINNIPAQVRSTTEFRFGSAADLQRGVELIATGKPDTAGRLQLEQVEIRNATTQRTAPGQVQLSARVQAVDSGRELLQLAGLQVRVGRDTQFRDLSLGQTIFNLNHLSTADTVTVFGFIDLQQGIINTERMQREPFNAGDSVRLQGPLEAADDQAGRLRLLGKTIEINAQTRFFDDSYLPAPPLLVGQEMPGLPISQPKQAVTRELFFSRAEGAKLLLEVNGTLTGDIILARQVVLLPLQTGR